MKNAAVQATNLSTVTALLNAGAEVNKTNLHGDTALHFGTSNLLSLIINWNNLKARLVFKVSDAGEFKAKLAEILVEKEADVNAANEKGRTPLHPSIILFKLFQSANIYSFALSCKIWLYSHC